MINAKKARLIANKQYSHMDIKELYDIIENTIIEEAQKGNFEANILLADDKYITRTDARAIKSFLKSNGYKWVDINIDTVVTISFRW